MPRIGPHFLGVIPRLLETRGATAYIHLALNVMLDWHAGVAIVLVGGLFLAVALATLFTLYAAARRWQKGARWRVGFTMLYAFLGGLNTAVNSELARPGPNVWSVRYGAMGGVGTYWGLYGLFTVISSPWRAKRPRTTGNGATVADRQYEPVTGHDGRCMVVREDFLGSERA